MDSVRVAARSVLIDVLSCRRGMSNSGVVSRIAGEAIGADGFLPNMGTEDFLLCLSRQALEAAAKEANVQPRPRVRETRAALVDHFASTEATFVHPAALFAPDPKDIADLLKHGDCFDEENGTVEEATGDIEGNLQPGASDNAVGSDAADLDHQDPDADAVTTTDDASDAEETAYAIAAE
jgi:hypothetical protein